MLEVAVIGAGAAGLVASRYLIQQGLRPCIFESSNAIGGLWNIEKSSVGVVAGTTLDSQFSQQRQQQQQQQQQRIWNSLSTNLSKHTCSFSDFQWPDGTSTFPSHTEMNHYLEEYAKTYIPDPDFFKLGCTVTNVRQNDFNGCSNTDNKNKDSISVSGGYRVEWVEEGKVGTDTATTFQNKTFDGVVVATGFFSSPHTPEWPSSDSSGSSGRNTISSSRMKVIHSSQYDNSLSFQNQTVAVIGSSFSALEIASDVRKKAKRVISILPSIPWVVPRWIPDEHGRYLPVDLVFYQKNTDDYYQKETITLNDEESCRIRHDFLKQILGTRKQSIIGIPDDSKPPMVAISDEYLNLVIDGSIEVVHGRLSGGTTTDNLEKSENHDTILLENGEKVTGVDSVISCTGYRTKLDFLSQDILDTVEYDSTDGFAPLILCHDTFHPKLKGLGFIGMYRGPFFGVMELQARLFAQLLANQYNHKKKKNGRDDGKEEEQLVLSREVMSHALEVSQKIRDHHPRAQFPHFDYIGRMDALAKDLQEHLNMPIKTIPINSSSPLYGTRKGQVILPAFYQPNVNIARKAFSGIQKEFEKSENGSNIPNVVLNAIIGKWNYRRTIRHFPSLKEETVSGKIQFSTMLQSRGRVGREEEKETTTPVVLYREDGIYRLPSGRDMEIFREYEYQQKDNMLEIYFVEGGKRAHLFLSLLFQKNNTMGNNSEAKGGKKWWEATSDHLCIKDLYKGNFKIALDGISATEIMMSYRVKGPQKDYEAITRLRPTHSSSLTNMDT